MTLLKQFLSNFSNSIFEGSYVEKSQCIFILITLAGALLAILLALTLLIVPDRFFAMNREGYQELREIASLCSLYSLILYMAGNFIKQGNNRWYAHLCLYSYAMVNALILLYIGAYSIGTGIALAGAPLIGLIIFDKRLTFSSLFIGLVILAGFTLLVQLEIINYSPIIIDHKTPNKDPVWLITMFTFVIGHLALLIAIGDVSIKRWKQREAEVTYLSATDPLTQLANRRTLMKEYKREYLKGMRTEQPLSIFLVDLDHFKQVNDTYGHLSGDIALKSAAKTLKATVRETDVVGRYGGEEFLAILPNTGSQAAVQIADRFRRALQALLIELPDQQRLQLTASIGLNTRIPESLEDLDHFLAETDAALYLAKENGRNQVSIVKEEGDLPSSSLERS